MNKIKYASILFLIIGFSSCQDQAGLLAGGIIKNLFTGDAYNSTASNEVYDKIKDTTEFDDKINKPTCVKANTGEVLNISTAKDLLNIKERICSCKAWGSCDNQSCSCNKLCPMDFDILDRGIGQELGQRVDDQFAFSNSSLGASYSNYEGFCWGYATLNQKFNRLATFSLMEKVSDEIKNNPFRRADYYKEIIAKIKHNEPVTIPGFRSLKDFSADPEVQEALQPAIADEWQVNAASIQGLSSVTQNDPLTHNQYSTLFDEIDEAIKNHQTPKVLFNKVGYSGWAHVVQVQSVKKLPNGNRVLCVWDNAYPAADSVDCKKKMELNRFGGLQYGYATVGHIELPHNEKSDVVAQVTNLQKMCTSKYNCLESNQ
jgi:hypothetical protein